MNSISKRQNGFTIVELLIVIVVIGILAAITIVAYTGIQDRAKNAAIASDMKNFSTKAEIYRLDNGQYPVSNVPQLSTLKFTATQSAYPSKNTYNFEYCTSSTQNEYILISYLNGGDVMYVSSSNMSPMQYDPGTINERPTGGFLSPCYSGTPYSAADRAGLGQIGVIDEAYQVVSGVGLSGKGSVGWTAWTTGGSN